jgi:hypothetical protein
MSYTSLLRRFYRTHPPTAVAYPGILFGGVQQIQLMTEGKENGDLGAVAPNLGFPLICK